MYQGTNVAFKSALSLDIYSPLVSQCLVIVPLRLVLRWKRFVSTARGTSPCDQSLRVNSSGDKLVPSGVCADHEFSVGLLSIMTNYDPLLPEKNFFRFSKECIQNWFLFKKYHFRYLRASPCKYREWDDNREISDFFIFSPNSLCSELFSKIPF